MKTSTKILIGIVLLTFLSIASFPTFLSSSWVKPTIVQTVNFVIPGEIAIENLRLGWFGENRVEGLVLKDTEGKEVVQLETLGVRTSWWRLLIGTPDLRHVNLSGFNLSLVQRQDGLNLDQALGFNAIPFDLPLNATLKMQNIMGKVNLDYGQAKLNLTGQTSRNGQAGSFAIDANFKEEIVHLKAQIKDFPVELIDAVIAMKYPGLSGLSKSVLGGTINLDVDETLTQDEIEFLINAKSGLFSSTFKGNIKDGSFSLADPATMQFQIQTDQLPDGWELKQPAQVLLSLDQLEFGFDGSSLPAIDARIEINSKHPLVTPIGKLNIDQIRGSVTGREAVSFSLEQIPTALIDALLNSDHTVQKTIGPVVDLKMEITKEKNAELALHSDKFEIPKMEILLESTTSVAQYSGLIRIPEAIFHETTPPTHLKSIYIPWNFDLVRQEFTAKYEGSIQNNEQTDNGTFSGVLNFSEWEKTLRSHVKLRAKRIPTELFANTLDQYNMLPLIGEQFQINLVSDLVHAETPQGEIDLGFEGTDIKAHIALLLDGQIRINPKALPPELRITVTPERYVAIRRMIRGDAAPDLRMALLEPVNVMIKVKSFGIPQVNEGEKFPFWKAAISADVKVDRLNVTDRKQDQVMTFQNLRAKLRSPNIASDLQFKVSGTQVHRYNPKSELQFTGSLQNGFLSDGSLNREELNFALEGSAKALPAGLFARALIPDPSVGDKMEAMIGELMTADIKIDVRQMQGPVYANLTGPNGSINFDGRVSNGVLTLDRPFTAEVKPTEKLGREVLKTVIPFLSELRHADEMILFEISPDKFALPLRDFSIRKVQMGKATLTLGKIYFSNSGELKNIVNVFGKINSKEISIWFTPLYMALDKGVLKLARMDMLVADQYPLATWGKIDLFKDKVNMTIGISGAALVETMKISGLPDDYFLQLQLKGPIRKAAIDKKQAAARIGALFAKAQGSTEGTVVGSILELVNQTANGKVPKPTTNPLPWAKDKPAAEKQQEKPDTMKQIEKGAKSLLKEIFK